MQMHIIITILPMAAIFLSHAYDEPATIEKRIVSSRTSIKTLRATLNIRFRILTAPEANYDQQVDVWLSNDKLRTDWHANRIKNGRIFPHKRLLYCRGCTSDGSLISYSDPKTAVVYHPAGSQMEKEFSNTLVDPRKLGLTTAFLEAASRFPFNKTVGSPESRYEGVDHTTLNNESAILVHSVHVPTGIQRHLWVLPDKGYSLARLESVAAPGSDDPTWRARVDIQPEQDTVSGTWFIRSSKYTQIRHGQVAIEEEIQVAQFEVNRPIDPAVFTPAGFGLPGGTPVMTDGAPRPRFWDGKQVTAKPPFPLPVGPSVAPQPIPVVPPPSDTDWRYVAAAVGLSLAATAFLWRAIRRR